MGIKIDTKSAIKDFDNYDRKTQRKLNKTLDTYSKLIRSTQWSILRNKVIKWTGNLANSITIDKKENEREIGPKGVVYANWIEYGGRGGFSGYHYMRDSLKQYKGKYFKQIKKDIEK